ncbi:hypothetical protein MSAN_02137700 [Mycena sanguinolenta]|uniref:Uncharacterized protein n=1 Tax=Mycena sanguinolenta TaxID=230812 RepID=A0A8H6XHL3_9AGAR|nr:hypothetical protein MSAN_02137700 [Mycena sanguinolenta]
MDPNPEFAHPTTYDPEFSSHASGMFSHSHHFTVTGKTFTNITNNYVAALSLPPDSARLYLFGIPTISRGFALGSSASALSFSRHHQIVRVGYVVLLVGSAQSLPPASDYLWLDWQSPGFPALSGKYSWSECAENIAMFVDSVTLEEYHRICTRNLSHHRRFDLSASTTVNFGAAFRFSNDRLKNSVEIAFSPSVEAPRLRNWTNFERGTGEVMPGGWTRFQSGHVFNDTVHVSSTIPPYRHTWLSQANHIFRHLHITSNFEDYVNSEDEDFEADIDLDGNSVDAEHYESEYPPTSTCDDSDVKPKSSHDQETFCHSASGDGGSDHAEISNCENYDASKSSM